MLSAQLVARLLDVLWTTSENGGDSVVVVERPSHRVYSCMVPRLLLCRYMLIITTSRACSSCHHYLAKHSSVPYGQWLPGFGVISTRCRQRMMVTSGCNVTIFHGTGANPDHDMKTIECLCRCSCHIGRILDCFSPFLSFHLVT